MKRYLLVALTTIVFLKSGLSQDSQSCNNFTYSELQTIGEKHTEFVLRTFESVDFRNSSDMRADAIRQLKTYDINWDALQVSQADFFDTTVAQFDYFATFGHDIRNWVNHPFSAGVYDILVDIYDAVDNLTSVESFNGQMDELQETANSAGLNCLDLEIITATISVAKSSAYIWTPADMGGYDLLERTFGESELGYNFPLQAAIMPNCLTLDEPNDERAMVNFANYTKSSNNNMGWWNWKSAFLGDLGASATYFTGMGIGLAAGLAVPGTNVAILAGWALNAAAGSVIGGIAIRN